jgi:hypothetical protein
VGCPPYVGHEYEYQPPGRHAPWVHVGRRGPVRDADEGSTFAGHDEVVPLAEPRVTPSGLQVVAAIWHRGEAHGPPDGLVVGLHYRLGVDLLLEAWRDCARAVRGDSDLWVEARDALFLTALSEYLRRPEVT